MPCIDNDYGLFGTVTGLPGKSPTWGSFRYVKGQCSCGLPSGYRLEACGLLRTFRSVVGLNQDISVFYEMEAAIESFKLGALVMKD